jgi:hypothetical protein
VNNISSNTVLFGHLLKLYLAKERWHHLSTVHYYVGVLVILNECWLLLLEWFWPTISYSSMLHCLMFTKVLSTVCHGILF